MKSVILSLLIACVLYQSLGLMPAIESTISEEQKETRDHYTVGEENAPFVTLRIDKDAQNFKRLGFIVKNDGSVSLNGITYDVLSTRIFSDFIELRISENYADLLARLADKESKKDTNENGLRGKIQVLLFGMVTEPQQFGFTPSVLVDQNTKTFYSYPGGLSSGYLGQDAMPPEA